jgi:hypothetical protein
LATIESENIEERITAKTVGRQSPRCAKIHLEMVALPEAMALPIIVVSAVRGGVVFLSIISVHNLSGFLVGEGLFVGVDNEGELAGDALGSVHCNWVDYCMLHITSW